ncbi:hypothetical protein LT85_4812 [Collimonas arenae]|uniref:Uncharacterized protein n=1 Tax=Collimonas arenae TaxID=279058 RepID=A0A0A1FJQ2_9BURK|nr:hypothetical protein LT85_4812 [Collimonas arenae]
MVEVPRHHSEINADSDVKSIFLDDKLECSGRVTSVSPTMISVGAA